MKKQRRLHGGDFHKNNLLLVLAFAVVFVFRKKQIGPALSEFDVSPRYSSHLIFCPVINKPFTIYPNQRLFWLFTLEMYFMLSGFGGWATVGLDCGTPIVTCWSPFKIWINSKNGSGRPADPMIQFKNWSNSSQVLTALWLRVTPAVAGTWRRRRHWGNRRRRASVRCN